MSVATSTQTPIDHLLGMGEPPATASSTSSDYFESEDPAFNEALQNTVLPGDAEDVSQLDAALNPEDYADPIQTQHTLKRSHSMVEDLDETLSSPCVIPLEEHLDLSDEDQETYGASTFGGFGQYMRRKRAKLQIQNAQMDDTDDKSSEKSRIFQGIAIYIDGWTQPSVQDLRQLIVKHGGTFRAYLDRKAIVTHIITCSLTPAKIQDWKHMKIVTPDWLVKSVEAGALLPWKDFIFRPDDRADEIQGTKRTQKSLFDGFVSQTKPRTSTNPPSDESPTDKPKTSTNTLDTSDASIEVPVQQETESAQSSSESPQSALNLLTGPKRYPSKYQAIYMTDPATKEQAARVPGYAADKSNLAAQRVMANPEWRSAHTSVAPDFIEGYYKNSRLHYLATWKAELKNLVSEAQDRAESGAAEVIKVDAESNLDDRVVDGVSMRGTGLNIKSPKAKGKQKAEAEEKIIMHCDFDSFFVSAGLVDRPHLRGKPVVVCHSQGTQGGSSSTSEIASSSYEARKSGIKNGMSLQQARKLCPSVMTIPYEFERYKRFSLQFYTILMSHADDLQAVSVDEALVDVTTSVAQLTAKHPSNPDPAKEFAEMIRLEVKKATGCEVSIGIAHNIMLARLATRRAKPAGSYHLVHDDVAEFMAPLEIMDLWGFGWATHNKAEEKLGVTILGELAKKSKSTLCDALGKGTGETLYKAIRGIDEHKLESDKPRKSVSCEINYGIRFENNEQAEGFIRQMAAEVVRRLDAVGVRGRLLTLKIMKRDVNSPVEPPKFLGHGACDMFSKQTPLATATSDDKVIGDHAWRLLKSFNFDPKDLRGIGIQIQKLESSSTPGNPDAGQAQLPFKRLETPTKSGDDASSSRSDTKDQDVFRVVVQPPSDDIVDVSHTVDEQPVAGPSRAQDPGTELPSFSQIDMEVFDALPDDVRKELEAEYKRRSHPPESVSLENPAHRPEPRDMFPKITVKGTNVRRITQQLAPKTRSVMSAKKHNIFRRSGISITDDELRELDIDPEVFALLPEDMHREQLSLARQAKKSGGIAALVTESNRERIEIKATYRRSRSPSVLYRKKPPPQANYLEPVGIKRPGGQKGERLSFTETEDVQKVIQSWVETYQQHPPYQKDIDFFAKFLVQSADSSRSTDTGMEKSVAVLKWWLMLIRRYWAMWEHEVGEDGADVESTGSVSSIPVGKAWWKAFRDVKEQVDLVARKKFGGSLSIR